MKHLAFAAVLLLGACGDDAASNAPCGTLTDASRVASGDARGHADPAGAYAAHQARAGRIDDLSIVHRADDARQAVRAGDYLLANDKLAIYIEAARPADGYTPFGGEIVAIETYAPDGTPRGTSEYGESLFMYSGQVVAPDTVSVIADGSDGGPAIVRSSGVLKSVPFLGELAPLVGEPVPVPAAIDYVLQPGEQRVQLRFHILNPRSFAIDTNGNELMGFFHGNRGKVFTDRSGFGPLDGTTPGFVAWDAGTSAFAVRMRGGQTQRFGFEVSGFQLFVGSGIVWPACQTTDYDYAELIAADDLDGLRETIRALDGGAASRAITATLTDAGGAPIAGAYLHATLADGSYVARALSDAAGRATLHVPGAGKLDVTAPGYVAPASQPIDADVTTAAFTLGQTGTLVVHATETGSGLDLPVRVMVLPMDAPVAAPAAFGVPGEAFGRLHQVFAETGKVGIIVPVGKHRVVVSRGYEYELDDRVVDVAAGAMIAIDAQLAHSVDSTGAMCADFHIHSSYSTDADDPVLAKVRSALAEGLDIPISSEHEYVIDFQPYLEQLGMTKWAHGLSSEELTTFSYGHFGVVPRMPDPNALNRGAVDWAGKQPGEVFAAVHALPEQPALIINHPYSTTFQGYFTTAMFDNASATGDPTLYSPDFDAIEVTNNSDVVDNRTGSIASWFSLLDHGKRVFAVGSSDSHHFREDPVGYPRTCLQLGHDDPSKVTAEAVRDAVKAGHAMVTGGLYLTVTGPGGTHAGDTIASPSGKLAFDVVVQAPSWIDAQTLEVIVDGQSVQTIPLVPSVVAGPAKRWDAPVDVDLPATLPIGGFHWVVFHAASTQDLAPVTPGRHPFGLSNPIFF